MNDFTEPVPKKRCKLEAPPPWPLLGDSSRKIRAVFSNQSVTIDDAEDMKRISSGGYFGNSKGGSVRAHRRPVKTHTTKRKVLSNRLKWYVYECGPDKVVISDKADETAEISDASTKDEVHLDLEEAFFLVHAVDCLEIYDSTKLLNLEELWTLFKDSSKNFTTNYIAYYYYRAKNWVVKTGIKFGGDYALYKTGPPFYHSSYIAIIDVLDCNLARLDQFKRRGMDMVNLMGLNRICETVKKELLICQIICPEGVDYCNFSFSDLSKFSIREVLMKRWISSREREDKNEANTDSSD